MRILYFASLRERVGLAAEQVEVPATVSTVADLVGWLRRRGPQYDAAFASPAVRAAVDHVHAQPGQTVAGATEIAFFPPMTGG